MFSSAEKTSHHATAVQQKTAGASFFRKAVKKVFSAQKKRQYFLVRTYSPNLQ